MREDGEVEEDGEDIAQEEHKRMKRMVRLRMKRTCKKSKFSKFWLFWCGGGLKCPKNRNFRNFGFFGEKHRSAHQKIGIFEFSGFLGTGRVSGDQKN